jgi:hypothetical protein
MKQNMLVTSYDYDVSKRLAEKLAEVFSMRTLDMISLFEFDHSPNTFSEIYKINGKEYIEKEFRSILKMELDFDNVVFVANLGFADKLQDLFYKIKLSNFVILLKKDIESEIEEIKNKQFETKELKDFYLVEKEQLISQEHIIEKDCADIVVDISNLTDDEIIDNIIDKIKNYYSVN